MKLIHYKNEWKLLMTSGEKW